MKQYGPDAERFVGGGPLFTCYLVGIYQPYAPDGQAAEQLDNTKTKGVAMKKPYLLFLLLMLIPIKAQAGEWVLWQCEFMSESLINPPIPLSEHKTLKACQNASKQVADATFLWAKNNETVKTETVIRSLNPDGAIYTYKKGSNVTAEFRCYPAGVVPTQGHFQATKPPQ